ncbi:MAG TPA: methyltransferase domain-containing protein [Acholeplasma sp.]|nr:methyltransferase domain-containing protein [Acholeplasma sp.]
MYKTFAAYYDKIFPRNPKIVDFLSNTFESGDILDLACGTGEYSVSLAHKGFNVVGSDLSLQMIEYAKSKAKKEKVSIDFKVEDMLDLNDENLYDGVVCIGNALVHLVSIEAVKNSLSRIYAALKPGKKVVIQIINYDLILKDDVKGLSTIQNGAYSFVRNYEYDGVKIHFRTRLTDGLKVFVDDTLLLPIKYDELVKIIKTVGFKDIEAAGGFTKPVLNLEKDVSYVVVATK